MEKPDKERLWSVEAYDKDGDTYVTLGWAPDYKTAAALAEQYLPFIRDGTFRNSDGRLSRTGEPFDWISVSGPGHKAMPFTFS